MWLISKAKKKKKITPEHENLKLWKNEIECVKTFLLDDWSLWPHIIPPVCINFINVEHLIPSSIKCQKAK